MYILGISCFYHDAAAVILKDGKLIAAAEEERFTRKKHDYDFPEKAIKFCLEHAGITARKLDYVVFYEKPFLKFERILMTSFQAFPKSWRVFKEAMITWLLDKLWIKQIITAKLGISDEKILFNEHHLSHAASAFYSSPFEEAAIMTVDGVGEWTTITLGKGRDTEIELIKEQRFPHSLGLLYSTFTAFLGFRVNNGEYKVMGMASYGKPRYTNKIYRNLIRVAKDGSFRLNMDYFSYHYSPDKMFSPRFEKLFGKPRVPGSHFSTPSSGRSSREDKHYADVAASIQRVIEEVLLKMVNRLYKETGLKNLCMAGGVGLNSVANGRILRESPFEKLYIQPAAGDSGGALGAALWVYHGLLGNPRKFVMEHTFWGKSYSKKEIKQFLKKSSTSYEYISSEETLTDKVVDYLLEGKIIGWFQGRFEWGPRALGNRSILADPRKAEMKDIVNTKIKFREPFRPFAPVILEDKAKNFFESVDPKKHYPARFMLLVLPWKDNKKKKVQAVSHLGTGRPQTIRREWNPRYYRVVEKFGKSTGVPVLLNTSFNLRGEPIVNSPADALNTFKKSGIDVLVLENYIIKKG